MKSPLICAVALALSGCVSSAQPVSTMDPPSPLAGKNYIIEMSSSQSASGLSDYLVPPLAKAIGKTGLRPQGGPGADVVFNVVWDSDVGKWMQTSKGRQWVYTAKVIIGISPENYVIPFEGTPQFGVTVSLKTLNADREDEMACMIDLGVQQAVYHYRPKGMMKIDGAACGRDKL